MTLTVCASLFIECLRKAFSLQLENLRNFCNLPWMRNMTDIQENQEKFMKTFPSCNSSIEYSIADKWTGNFSALAANYGHPSCIGNSIPYILLQRFNVIITPK